MIIQFFGTNGYPKPIKQPILYHLNGQTTFDLTISNFVLEHVNPVETLAIKKLLKPSEMLVFTVLNSSKNSGDYFVIDRINKFTFSYFKAIKIVGFDNYKILEDIFKGSFLL